jgi:hypothetical protein
LSAVAHRSLLWVWLVVCFSAGAIAAQNTPAQRSFHASKAELEKALHDLPSYPGGNLPDLNGFADAGSRALDSYQRGHYQYELQLKPDASGNTVVQVTAKITAWYSAGAPANSGYRLLKSNGRLESDLFDALQEKLNPNASTKVASANPAPDKSLPDTPARGDASYFNFPRLNTAPSSAQPVASKTAEPGSVKRIQQLTQTEGNLEQILHNQARPANLAVVKRSNTPVALQPVDGSEVLFQADAEDEFEILDSTDGWVHIKVSGISRGWIKREYVDVPGAATVSVAALSVANQHDSELVRQTKAEIGAFPGKWEPLDGKQVKIIWVQPHESDQFGAQPKWGVAKTVFRSADAGNPADTNSIAGVVVIFDSQDGGMAATTLANLQQWRAGHLSDDSFWKRCWHDPADAFQSQR